MPLSGSDAAAAHRLAAIIESSDDAIVSKNLDGIIVSWNRAAERIFGYTAEEAIGRSIRLIIPADRQFEEDEVLARIRRGDRVEHFETMRQRKDGTLIAIALTVSPIRNAEGVIIGASKIARDITEQRRNAVALEQTRAAEADLQTRLRALVEASSDVLASLRVSDVMSAVLAVAGRVLRSDGLAIWRLDEGQSWRIRAHAGLSSTFADRVVATYAGAPATTIPFAEPRLIEDVRAEPLLAEHAASYEVEGIRSMAAVPLRIAGQLTASLSLYFRTPHRFSDIEIETARALGNMTAAAITTAELYDEQRRLRERADFLAHAGTALGSSLDYHMTLGKVVDLAVPEIADWCTVDMVSDDGAIERLAVKHVDPTKMDLVQTLAKRYDDPESPYSLERVIRAGHGVMLSRITDEMIVAAARGDLERIALVRSLGLASYICVPMVTHGRVVGALTFVAAESGRHFTESDLRFAEDVAQRAALAVDNARAYEETRRANQLKDEFLATLSHELRTPLNAILGYTRMLRSGVLRGDKQARAFDILERNATTLSQIVADILDVSRIISGKLQLELVSVDLTTVVGDALATVLPAAEAKGVTINASVEPQSGAVLGDADRLRQVVWNLVSNAVKFTPKGGHVDVEIDREGDYAALVVRDTGVGIAPDFLPHVFERFRQADSRFAREHGGLGLGLAIARHLVEMHGGSLQASSEGVGRGATFRALFPLVPKPADASVAPEPVETPSAEVRSVLLDLRVLAVDDDPDALLLIRDALEDAGAVVATATSAEDALRQLEAEMPDLMITDLGMPAVDGFELVRRVRTSDRPRLRALPTVALTAYARPDDRIASALAGFQLHMTKPIDPRALVSAIAGLTGRASSLTQP